jgi:hypothetical protein
MRPSYTQASPELKDPKSYIRTCSLFPAIHQDVFREKQSMAARRKLGLAVTSYSSPTISEIVAQRERHEVYPALHLAAAHRTCHQIHRSRLGVGLPGHSGSEAWIFGGFVRDYRRFLACLSRYGTVLATNSVKARR